MDPIKRKILNWHTVNDERGREALLGVFSCGHLLHYQGPNLPEVLPRVEVCGVCMEEAQGAAKPHEAPSEE